MHCSIDTMPCVGADAKQELCMHCSIDTLPWQSLLTKTFVNRSAVPQTHNIYYKLQHAGVIRGIYFANRQRSAVHSAAMLYLLSIQSPRNRLGPQTRLKSLQWAHAEFTRQKNTKQERKASSLAFKQLPHGDVLALTRTMRNLHVWNGVCKMLTP